MRYCTRTITVTRAESAFYVNYYYYYSDETIISV